MAGTNHTRLIAIAIADPRGAIPDWLINWVGKSLTHDTMAQLRDQVKRSDIPDLIIATRLYIDE